MGRVHVETLVRLALDGRIQLVAIGDRHAPTVRAAADLVVAIAGGETAGRLEKFADPDEMAERARLDAVVISSRTDEHAQDGLAFVRRGSAVLLEKPMANTIAEALEFSRALGEDGSRLVQIGFQRHYDAANRAAIAWVTQKLIGDLQQTHHVLQDKNPTPEGYQSPGITADMAIHLVFEAMSVRGFELPRSVQAVRFLAPHYQDRAGEGANIVHVFAVWADGSLAHLWGSRINGTGYDNGFKLIGTDGRIDAGDFTGDFGGVTAKLWRGTGRGPIARGTLTESLVFPMTTPRADHPDFYPRYADAYQREVEAFLECVREGRPLDPGPDIGWKTLLVANVAEASSRSGGRPYNLMLQDGRPVATIDDAAAFATEAGLA
jgi:myo-inositol 2-dehydrogenase/D-chiro-inositol 1-dehydrogenase